MNRNSKYIVGIDEVGRGPLAGPVAVGALCVPRTFDMSFFDGIKDSKQLSAKDREEWFKKIRVQFKLGNLFYKVSFSNSKTIDEKGIVKAIYRSIVSCLKRLPSKPENSLVLLDGALKAPVEFVNQRTIIRGDEKIKVISAASIMAKVMRDKRMTNSAKKYPLYAFEDNKGYGTRFHYCKIIEFGPCDLHRTSFLKKLYS